MFMHAHVHLWTFATFNVVLISTPAISPIFTQGGEKVPQRGYWGDIVNSPYIAIGCECDNEDMYKKRSGLYTKVNIR